MADEPTYIEQFRDSKELLAFLKEKSDDIEKAVIPQNPTLVIVDKEQRTPIMEIAVGMVLHMANGHCKYIGPHDAEILLNDGILNRMRIRIELYRGQKQ
jgi:hypothetical protein